MFILPIIVCAAYIC
ncbi:hypothetical protein [Lysinibacillus sp. D4A1_S13]|nr:hypothetical protein [Lysinibacillus sp. D4A1_S13]